MTKENNLLKVTIISQTKKIFEGDSVSVIVPGTMGIMQILKDHASIVSLLDIGAVKIEQQNSCIKVVINGGILSVSNNNVLILANEAYLPENIIARDIENAIKMAEEKKSHVLNTSELIQLEKQIRFERFKQKVIKDNL